MKKGDIKEPMEKDAVSYKHEQKNAMFRRFVKRWVEKGLTKQQAWAISAIQIRKPKVKEQREIE